VSRQQQEEIRRIQESRQSEMEALRIAIEAERNRIVEAERSLAAAERALSVAQGRGETPPETALAESIRQLENGVQLRRQISGSVTPRPADFSAPSTNFAITPFAAQNSIRTTAALAFLLGENALTGADLVTLNSSLARYFEVDAGVLVTSVTEASPASEAGLLPGDVIVEIGGEAVAEIEDLGRMLPGPRRTIATYEFFRNYADQGAERPVEIQAPPPGTSIPLRIIREGRSMEIVLEP
jgi:membrane-associated protease RseP (regulator of RpoE activity)